MRFYNLMFVLAVGMIMACASCDPKGDKKSVGEEESGAKSNIELVLEHQTKRFEDLKTILAKNPMYRVKFPGQDADNHALGAGIAKSRWSAGDYQRMKAHISQKIKELDVNRVSFGMIGDYLKPDKEQDCDRTKSNPQGVPGLQSDGTFIIHVWGANQGNFNLEDQHAGSFGSGQASCFEKQRPGVFGISTMPEGDKATLMAPDKLLSQY